MLRILFLILSASIIADAQSSTTVQPPKLKQCDYISNGTEALCQSWRFQTDPTYIPGECYCTFSVPNGYQIEVEIEKLDLDGDAKNYVSIKADNSSKNYKLIYFFEKPQKYFVFENAVHIYFNGNASNGKHKGFSIRLKRYGEELTTTLEPPTTEVDWPAPSGNESIFNTVYIAGPTPNEFVAKEEEFTDTMVNITKLYCDKYKIPYFGNITKENINLNLATQCSVLWPDSKNCVKLRYAIPIFLQNGTDWKGYQLTLEHLERMWNEFMIDEIKVFNWTIYEIPDNESTMLIWLYVCIGIVAVFVGFLFYIKSVSFRCGDHVKRKYSDTEQIISTPQRVSDASLWPMSNQVVPPLFDNEAVYSYYEPEMTMPRSHHSSVSISKNMVTDEEDSDEEILNINHVSPRTSNYDQPKSITLNDNLHQKESAL